MDGDNLLCNCGQNLAGSLGDIGPSSFIVWLPLCLNDVCFVISNVSYGVGDHLCASYYNFQRRMSRLEQRWRAQRSVISNVNCRKPWINRDLNVYCAFGISLKACLLQCQYAHMPLSICRVPCVHVSDSSACLCIKVLHVPLMHAVYGFFAPSATWKAPCVCHLLLCMVNW